MAVVWARRHDEVWLRVGEHGRRLHVVQPQLEAGPPTGFLELAQPPVALLRPPERARDVDDSPPRVAKGEQRGGRTEHLVVRMRREVDRGTHRSAPHSAAPIAPARSPSSASTSSIRSSGATRAWSATDARIGPSSSSPAAATPPPITTRSG